jgi:predicted RNase H-like HicB family nuclease
LIDKSRENYGNHANKPHGERFWCIFGALDNSYKLKICILPSMAVQVPLPILIAKESKWFVASCPILDIATQGRTEKEVKENMADLISEYLRDPDTPKPSLEDLMSLSLANITVSMPEGVLHRKALTTTSTRSN